MEGSPRYREISNLNPTPLPSPTSRSCISSSSDSCRPNQQPQTPTRPVTRSESGNPYPTTFVQADTSSFKQVVQMLTGSFETTAKHAAASSSSSSLKPNNTQPDPNPNPKSSHSIPPIKSINPKKHGCGSSGFRLYERRNSLKSNLKISPLNPGGFGSVNNNSIYGSTRKPEILSPSILDFPSLVLSPVTPLIPDPFDRSGPAGYSPSNCGLNRDNGNGGTSIQEAEEKAIKEKGFYLHPSPSTTPRDSEPRLLPLFPVTSPRVSGSSSSSASIS